MFGHLLESSRRDDSNNWLDIEFGQEIALIKSGLRLFFCTLSGDLYILLCRLSLLQLEPVSKFKNSVVRFCLKIFKKEMAEC